MRYVQSLLAKRIDGIVMNPASTLSREQRAQLVASGAPIVLLSRSARNHTFSTSRPTTKREPPWPRDLYWLGLGRRKIAQSTGPRQHGELSGRTRGFVRALQSAEDRVQPLVLHGKFNVAQNFRTQFAASAT
jgi:DNA-binding LacI/PurR family transcriptional regulator